jgi:hypothetical protein
MMSRLLPAILATSACVTGALDEDQESTEITGTTIVSLTFDDTLADQYQVGEMVAARGMRATFYVNSTRFGRSGSMTLEQVRSLQQRGNEIAGHTLDHVDLTAVSSDEARRQVCSDRDALLDLGFAVTSFAYPFGADNSAAQGIVRDCNYNSARDVGGLVAPTSCSGCPYANPIPPANAYQVRTNGSIRQSTTLDTMKRFVTQAEQNGGGWVPFVFHHVCNGCNEYAVSAADLTGFLDWLAARRASGTEVATVHAVIGGTVKPSSTGSPPPPTDDTQPPTARVSKPRNGTVVDGVTRFWADASDNVGVESVRFYVDGAQIAETSSSPYRIRWDTSRVSSGTHRLWVQAEDAAGNVTTSAVVTVTVR